MREDGMHASRTRRRAFAQGCSIGSTVAASVAAAVTAAAEDSPAAIDRLAWLAGCWSRETPTRIVEEQWMSPRGKMMLGMGRTVSKEDGRTIEFEAVRIEEREGQLVFTAKPSGQPEGSFHSIELTDSLVVFENPEHDFPQRVGYQRKADGSLAAWIEGRSGPEGAPKRVDFPYGRQNCPGSVAASE
jgi:hypothetical protein